MKLVQVLRDDKTGLATLVIRLSKDEYELLQELSSLMMKNPSAIIRDAIYMILGKHLDIVLSKHK